MARMINAVHMPDVMHQVTLTVSGMTEVRIRLRIAAMIFRFGAWVAGVGITITD